MTHITLYFLRFMAVCLLMNSAEGGDARVRLYTDILMNYQTLISPRQGSDPLRVGLALSLKHIGHVDVREGTVNVHIWLYQNWMDETLKWEIEEYNVSQIFIPRRIGWMPDTLIRNGIVRQETRSRDMTIYHTGEVAIARSMEVTIPCFHAQSAQSDLCCNNTNDEAGKKIFQTCSLEVGCLLEPAIDLVYDPHHPDTSGYHDSSTEWKLCRVDTRRTTDSSPRPLEAASIAVFNLTLVKNVNQNLPFQLIASSVITSLAAAGVFFLPPLAGERIIMVGATFLGQLILAGFSTMVQVESPESRNLDNFMIFSTVFIFLVIVAVLASFFVFPLLRRVEKVERENEDEDNSGLLITNEKRIRISWPDAVLFIMFLILYGVGMVTLFV